MEMWTLPAAWHWSTIGEVTTYVQRGKSPKYAPHSDLPVVNQKCIRWDHIETEHLKFVHPDQQAAWGDERFLRLGDVLWNSTGTGTLGRAAIFRGVPGYSRVVVDSHVTVLRPQTVMPEFLHLWIRSPHVQRELDRMYTGTTSQTELPRAVVLATPIPVPPWDEQQRIVARVAEMMERSGRARGALTRATGQASLMRQSLLHAASTGELSATWRDANKEVRTSSDLLSNCETEREQRWVEEGYSASQRARKRSSSLGRNDAEPWAILPDGWCWTTLSDLAWDAGYGTSAKCEVDAVGEPVLRIPNVAGGRLELDDLKNTITPLGLSAQEYLAGGDFLIVRTNGSLGLIGRASLIRPTELSQPTFYASYLIRYRLVGPRILHEWVSYMWQTPKVREQIESLAASSAGQYNLSLDKIAAVAIPIPPLDEIAGLLGQLQPSMDSHAFLVSACKTAGSDLELLESSVLAAAFAGEM